MSHDQRAEDAVLLKAARIIGVDRVIDNANALIEKGRISHVSETDSLSAPGAAAFDLSGLTLWPGFIDVHIHGAAGIDTMQASAEDLARVSRFLAGQGVTSWVPTLVPSSSRQYESAISAIEEVMREQQKETEPAGSLRSQVLGVHYEGPFVNAD